MRDCLPCRLSAGQRHTAAVEPDRVYFKSVWYDRKTRAIRDGLSSSRNRPLRGPKYYNEMMQALPRVLQPMAADAIAALWRKLEFW
jgi:hypothetical protein